MSLNPVNQQYMADAIGQFFKAQGNAADAYALSRNFEKVTKGAESFDVPTIRNASFTPRYGVRSRTDRH